ncbi:Asp-tRNA(Asn)/Glu-tRNA(Gln) amidotransferase GatCAB subunit B [Thermoplasmatales archaeon SW_10_69_26]|nr:MAG: Asp-tRNA(Asn)/Glu-tRNA(Gln) amidotransferase GatCAB subunit B [Thermoplasmatales archaeon SW_10_69_26]
MTRIGLEVHVPLDTAAKLYCRCPAGEAQRPNAHVCPTCTGQPGARPRGVNERAVELAVQAARVLDCHREERSTVLRKHYVYPDLPNNYQRTTTPVGREGSFWEVGIREVHLEEDPGAFDPGEGTVDLNRSGRPLVEIVTEPDLSSPEEVTTWFRVLRLALERAGVARPEAELKADVNVSTDGGDRVEVKNVVGARNAARAARFEIDRQRRERDAGREVGMSTRHYDEAKHTTQPSREKETVGDYRYMDEPDLRPIDLSAPAQRLDPPADVPSRVRELRAEVDVELGEALALLEEPELEELFAELRERTDDGMAVDVVLHRLRGELDYRDTRLAESPARRDTVAELALAWHADEITKHVFTRLLRAHLDGEAIGDQLAAERDGGVDLEAAVEEAIEANPGAVDDYEAGEEGAVNYLVGQVMQATQGRADPKETRETLREALEN